MDLEGRHYHTDRKARTANDRFVFSWCVEGTIFM